MGEADWWLCSDCQSLNNLSARKCYSCRRRKPKDAVRASEHLGYVPVVDQNGKISLEMLRPPVAEQLARAETGPPPLRDPVPRNVLAVAPQPPHGARITYQMVDAPPPPSAGAIAATQAGPGPLVAVGPGPVPAASGRPAAGPAPAAVAPAEQWPHWRDLLDVPKPEGDRLRAIYAPDVDMSAGVVGASGRRNSALSQAMHGAQEQPTDRTRRFVPWPEADRPTTRTETDHVPADSPGHPQAAPASPSAGTATNSDQVPFPRLVAQPVARRGQT